MNSIIKLLVMVMVILYILSPIDLCPGPIDDLIVVLLAHAANKRLAAGER